VAKWTIKDAKGPDQQTRAEIVYPAVVRLVADTRSVRQILGRRPALVAEALLGGAMPEQVAEAVGLDLDELRQAVGRWAVRRQREGRLTDDQYTDLINTVFGPSRW